MVVSSLEQHLVEEQKSGTLTTETIAAALQESRKNGEYLYNIRDAGLKKNIYVLLMTGCTDTTTMYVD